ncbi:MAG: hypothetical protein RIG84_12850 [Roseovarius sp.]
MTNTTQALKALLSHLDAGKTPDAEQIYAALGTSEHGLSYILLAQWACDPDDIRGLGAAKALHEAIAKRWSIHRIAQAIGGLWEVTLSEVGPDDERQDPTIEHRRLSASNGNLARAWVIALLKARIAEAAE